MYTKLELLFKFLLDLELNKVLFFFCSYLDLPSCRVPDPSQLQQWRWSQCHQQRRWTDGQTNQGQATPCRILQLSWLDLACATGCSAMKKDSENKIRGGSVELDVKSVREKSYQLTNLFLKSKHLDWDIWICVWHKTNNKYTNVPLIAIKKYKYDLPITRVNSKILRRNQPKQFIQIINDFEIIPIRMRLQQEIPWAEIT